MHRTSDDNTSTLIDKSADDPNPEEITDTNDASYVEPAEGIEPVEELPDAV